MIFHYFFQIGLVFLYLIARSKIRDLKDLQIILLSLDSFFVIGIITIFLDIILKSNNFTPPTMSISAIFLKELPPEVLNFLEITLNSEFKTAENTLSSLITIWCVSQQRKNYETIFESKGV